MEASRLAELNNRGGATSGAGTQNPVIDLRRPREGVAGVTAPKAQPRQGPVLDTCPEDMGASRVEECWGQAAWRPDTGLRAAPPVTTQSTSTASQTCQTTSTSCQTCPMSDDEDEDEDRNTFD